MAAKWGYKTPAHSIGTAGTACGVVLAANADRRYAHFQNAGAGTIFLGLGGSVNSQGIRLNPLGGAHDSYEMTVGIGNLYTGAVQAMSNTGGTETNTLLITEGV